MTDKPIRQDITTAEAAIELLGGTAEVSRMFDPPLDQRVVSNWKTRGLPPETWCVLSNAIIRLGGRFDAGLFRMYAPRKGRGR